MSLVLMGVFALKARAVTPPRDAVYPSGLLHEFVDENRPRGTFGAEGEARSLRRFLSRTFSSQLGSSPLEWREREVIRDATHTHHLYALYAEGRRVDGAYLRAHYNRDGWVQYASSTWDRKFSALPTGDTGAARAALESHLRQEIVEKRGRFRGRIDIEPIYWIDRSRNEAIPAFDVYIDVYDPMAFRHLIVEEGTERVLERRSVVRHVVSANVYLVSPSSSGTNFFNAGLPYLSDGATQLLNSFVYVRRQINYPDPTNSCGPNCLIDINPNTDYSQQTGATDGFSTDPASYNPQCSDASCGNQGFDAVNVYYHLSTYRQNLQPYFNTLGVSPTDARDPINVIVMAFDEEVTNAPGDTTPHPTYETNNAAFISRPCNVARGDGTRNLACLAFLRPAVDQGDINCPSNTPFYDVAREAVVMVHEYTHYITDSQAHLEQNDDPTDSRVVVGDALHEGYSDYFATSEVSYLNHSVGLGGTPGGGTDTDVTTVGAYAFQLCPYYERHVDQLKVYDSTDPATGDRYVTSLTWSSGLWNLRSQFGKDVVDQIALKSQLFLSPLPGFVEAVESLAHADQALFGGAHTDAIHSLFYTQLHFYGTAAAAFRDTDHGVVEVGFHSCNSVPDSGGRFPGAGLFAALAWLEGLLLAGRRMRRMGK